MKLSYPKTLALLCLVQACASIPSPSVLDEIDRVRVSRSAKGAQRDAPTAFATAEKLRNDAYAAFDLADSAGAQILGEQALAAYEEAVALARVVRADKEHEGASLELKSKQGRLARLDGEHQQIAADIAALERRLKVLNNLEPVSPSGKANPAREKARWQAVASLQLGARVLCSAATLLAKVRKADAKSQAPAALLAGKQALRGLSATLAEKPQAAPIDGAMRARAACLEALTRVRRGNGNPKVATGGSDGLLEALSDLGHGTSSRDDRGVVVTLRGFFDAGKLNANGAKALAAIGDVGKSHRRFPVMVVVYDAARLDDASRTIALARGAAVVEKLRAQLGAEHVSSALLAGNAAPVVDPRGRSKMRNSRIDVIFVSPENL